MDHLDVLESRTIYILREAFNKIDKLAMLWSIGKDFECDAVVRPQGVLRPRAVSVG